MCDFRNVNNDVAEAMNLSALEGLEERFSHQVSFAPSHNCFLSFTSIIPIGAGSNKRNWRNAFAPPTVSKTAFKKTPASTETLYPSGIKVYHQVIWFRYQVPKFPADHLVQPPLARSWNRWELQRFFLIPSWRAFVPVQELGQLLLCFGNHPQLQDLCFLTWFDLYIRKSP